MYAAAFGDEGGAPKKTTDCAAIRTMPSTGIPYLPTALAAAVAGGFIVILTELKFSELIYITIATVPLLFLWYFSVNRMHRNYKETLQSTLVTNKQKSETKLVKEYTINGVLEKEVASSVEEKVIYGMKLMEKLA